MATKKPPATWQDRLRKYAGHARPNVEMIEGLLDEIEEARNAAETVADLDVDSAIEDLRNYKDGLAEMTAHSLLVSDQGLALIEGLIDDLEQTLPGGSTAQELVEAFDEAREAWQEVSNHREDPRSYEPDEKQQARDELTEKLETLAGKLDEAAAEPAAELATAGVNG